MVSHDQLTRLEMVSAIDVAAENSSSSHEGNEHAETHVDSFPAGSLRIFSVPDSKMNAGKPHNAQDQSANPKSHETRDCEGRPPGNVKTTLCQHSNSRSIGRRSKSSSLALPPESK